MNLKNYSDNELLSKTKSLIKEEQKLLSTILSHLEEIERRKLFCDLGYTSLFDYCLKELRYSEQQAFRRINAMRAMKKLPELKDKVKNGTLSLSNINLASSFIKDANITSLNKQLEIFSEVEKTTKQKCEEKMLRLREDYGLLKPARQTVITKTSVETSRVHVNLSNETLHKLDKIKNLTKERDLDKIISLMADLYIEQKMKTTKKSKVTEKNSRYIPRKVKETIYTRAKGQCENCGSTQHLEFDHHIPYAKGGTNALSNITLLCSNCNKRKAIKDFGQTKMDYFLGNSEITFPGQVEKLIF